MSNHPKALKVTTKSGATYVVGSDGSVKRLVGNKEMSLTRDGYQYVNGFLRHSIVPDDLAVGGRIPWMGVVNDYTEPVTSSVIESIEEISDEDTLH